MAVDKPQPAGPPPPYTSFKTVLNTLDRMKEQGGAPSRIDRSYLANMPGGERSAFTRALKTLGLINDASEPTDELHALVDADEDERKKLLRPIIERTFPGPLALPGRATQQQLETSFREHGISGSTLRRAIGFFLAGTEFVGIERSTHFKLPKRERVAKPKTLTNGTPATPEGPPPPHPPTPKAPTMHPFIQGLVGSLPEPGTPFPEDKQDAWFDTARGIFRLIYQTESSPPKRQTAAPTDGGDSD